ncbi:hypothetical protein B0H14DRAFT_2701912 [Mycena olivaceomarginata]|nr:hypothetical protein B0H14DRAFT_2701912 [Mycena olivaceomarginata]
MSVPPTSPLHPRDRSVDAARLFPGLPIDANHANPFPPRHARTQRPHSLAADSSERASGRRPSYRFYLRLPALPHPNSTSLTQSKRRRHRAPSRGLAVVQWGRGKEEWGRPVVSRCAVQSGALSTSTPSLKTSPDPRRLRLLCIPPPMPVSTPSMYLLRPSSQNPFILYRFPDTCSVPTRFRSLITLVLL